MRELDRGNSGYTLFVRYTSLPTGHHIDADSGYEPHVCITVNHLIGGRTGPMARGIHAPYVAHLLDRDACNEIRSRR